MEGVSSDLHESRAYGGEKFMSNKDQNNILDHLRYHIDAQI